MNKKLGIIEEPVRDVIETLPELPDIAVKVEEVPTSHAEAFLDEALQESFPASDPPASGKME